MFTENMTQINDIKPIILWIPININSTILFIVFFIFLLILWKYLANKKENKVEKTEIVFDKTNVLDDLKKDLYSLERKYLNSSKDIFYQRLSEILKKTFEYKTEKDISKMTLTEINNLLPIKDSNYLKELIKNIYFKEYAKEIEDSEEIRVKLILEIKKVF